jgi:hypothetical protein
VALWEKSEFRILIIGCDDLLFHKGDELEVGYYDNLINLLRTIQGNTYHSYTKVSLISSKSLSYMASELNSLDNIEFAYNDGQFYKQNIHSEEVCLLYGDMEQPEKIKQVMEKYAQIVDGSKVKKPYKNCIEWKYNKCEKEWAKVNALNLLSEISQIITEKTYIVEDNGKSVRVKHANHSRDFYARQLISNYIEQNHFPATIVTIGNSTLDYKLFYSLYSWEKSAKLNTIEAYSKSNVVCLNVDKSIPFGTNLSPKLNFEDILQLLSGNK